ncbi:MAG: glycosyltransferase family 9 protein [Spirochaetia bacterium]|nr:glycosyltransferase family 9 protein [Spirochaetia bacterium]
MGDVALLVPVLAALAKAHSRIAITLVTRKAFAPFFYNIPGVEVIGADVDRDYKGILGLYRLFRELRTLGPYDWGIDVHGSMRTRLLKFFFRFTGLKFSSIVKGRREKNAQVRRTNKVLVQLPHMIERYMHVFQRAGISADPGRGPWINPDTRCRALAGDFLKKVNKTTKTNLWIGIAPFAGHAQKMWPIDRTRDLIRLITTMDATVFLFGGGRGHEKKILDEIHAEFPDHTIVVAGNVTLEGEVALMLRLDAMVAMDSFNMHVASLIGAKTLSIWGATHPFSGFGPYGPNSVIVQIDPSILPCRPCSIFGNKPCFRGDLACMNWITPEKVFGELKALVATSKVQ